jgi:peroxiredoxin
MRCGHQPAILFESRTDQLIRTLASLFLLATSLPLFAGAIPSVGDKAPDFALATTDGKEVRLSQRTSSGSVVLIVLRGYPGYQCPYCNRQTQDFIRNSRAFADAGVQVVLVYPGPAQDLGKRAKEFLADKSFPSNFALLLDPDYKFTNLYGLRWDAPHETAYPSTFLIDHDGIIFFSKVAKEHGGRTSASEILEALPRPKGTK